MAKKSLIKTPEGPINKIGEPEKMQHKTFWKSLYFWKLMLFWIIIGMTSKMFYNMQMLFEIGMFGGSDIKNIAARTNLILAAAGVIAALVAGPTIGYLIDKWQSYKKPIAIFLAIFVISTLFIFPFLTKPFITSDTTIFWLTLGIISPILGICYGYRTPIDPYSTVYAEHHKLPLTFTRGVYAIGFGVTGFGISYLIQWFADGHDQFYIYYAIYAAIMLLAFIYLTFIMEEPPRGKHKVEKGKVDKTAFKALWKNKVWILGLIAFFFSLGIYLSLDSLIMHTIATETKSWKLSHPTAASRLADPNEWSVVKVKGYQDLARAIPEAILFMVSSVLILKIGFKKAMISGSVIMVAILIGMGFALKNKNVYLFTYLPAFIFPIIGAFMVAGGMEFVASLTRRNIRSLANTTFNSITFGLGGLLFFVINFPFFTKSMDAAGHTWWVYLLYACFALIPLVIFTFFLPNLKSKVSLEKATHRGKYNRKLNDETGKPLTEEEEADLIEEQLVEENLHSLDSKKKRSETMTIGITDEDDKFTNKPLSTTDKSTEESTSNEQKTDEPVNSPTDDE